MVEVERLRDKQIEEIPDKVEVPTAYLQTLEPAGTKPQLKEATPTLKVFPWPGGTLHLLSLLQGGFINRQTEIPELTRSKAGYIIHKATLEGTLSDRKWALETTGIAPQSLLLHILRKAYKSRSQVWREVAYQQTSKIVDIPADSCTLHTSCTSGFVS